MYTALVSLLTDRTVKSDTAMTGEISLRGLVLPVGGIKEKVVAAARAGLATVILPARNRRDYDEIPESARNSLHFLWAERAEQVTEAALESAKSESSSAVRGVKYEDGPFASTRRKRAHPRWQIRAPSGTAVSTYPACQPATSSAVASVPQYSRHK